MHLGKTATVFGSRALVPLYTSGSGCNSIILLLHPGIAKFVQHKGVGCIPRAQCSLFARLPLYMYSWTDIIASLHVQLNGYYCPFTCTAERILLPLYMYSWTDIRNLTCKFSSQEGLEKSIIKSLKLSFSFISNEQKYYTHWNFNNWSIYLSTYLLLRILILWRRKSHNKQNSTLNIFKGIQQNRNIVLHGLGN